MKIPDLPRSIEETVRARLGAVPAVVLLGPRQVGKTTLARKVAADCRKLDDADAYLRAQHGRLVVIDEIHRVPHLFEVLRGIIGDWRADGLRTCHFLLLGSAALDLMQQASESLAGRVTYLDVAPLNVQELPDNLSADTLWPRGGFADSLLAANDAQSLNWRRDFIRSYLERDVPMFAPRLPVHPVAGHSFEGMVIESLINICAPRYTPYFYRTQAGAEIDLVLAGGNTPEIAIEVQRSSAPAVQKGFAIACEDLGIADRYAVYPGQERFGLRHGAQAIGLGALLQQLSATG